MTIPSVLYSGSLAVLQLFDVPGLLGVDRSTALTVTVWTVGLLGAAYAIIGGLKAVAVSDTLNGVGLLVIDTLVPVLMMVPGVIAFHLYGPGLATMDDAYPRLVSDVLPAYLSGLFLAVLLGAVFSSFNSLLNSAATLFAVDLFQPLRPGVSDATLIRVARGFGIVLALFSFLVAPMLQHAAEGLWQFIRRFTGFYNIPIVAIVLVAVFFSRSRLRVPPAAALATMAFHVAAYGILTFVWESEFTSSTSTRCCSPWRSRSCWPGRAPGLRWRRWSGRAST